MQFSKLLFLAVTIVVSVTAVTIPDSGLESRAARGQSQVLQGLEGLQELQGCLQGQGPGRTQPSSGSERSIVDLCVACERRRDVQE